MKRQPQYSVWRRSGFTLVEMLVVITIIALLVSLVVAGAFQVVGSQRQSNTEATMRTVMKVLNQHWEHVIAEAKKENMPVSFIGGYPSLDQARTAWINYRLQEAFPQNQAEINVPPPVLSPRKYSPIYKSKSPAGASPSVCVLLALSVSRGGTSLAPESLGSGQNPDPVTGLPRLVDGWGNPIVYVRNFVSPNGLPSNYWVPHLISTAANLADPNDDISTDYLGVK